MTPKAKEYLDRLTLAWERGADDAVIDIHDELNESQELYLEVWGYLPSGMRRQFKELIDRVPLDNKVKGGRICLICHSFWPETEALCPGCLKAFQP